MMSGSTSSAHVMGHSTSFNDGGETRGRPGISFGGRDTKKGCLRISGIYRKRGIRHKAPIRAQGNEP